MLFARAVEDIRDGVAPGIISAKFHLAVADLIAKASRSVREERKLNRVALSGGVFQNVFLLRAATKLLRSDGFEGIYAQPSARQRWRHFFSARRLSRTRYYESEQDSDHLLIRS
jgi:hydrogenase maturation factor HypF (carbamoyltransferase family)